MSQARVPDSILTPALEAPRLVIPLVIKEPPEPTVRELIIDYSKEYGIDSSLPLAIARAESNFIATATNPKSTASGVFQFLDSTWEHYCIDEYQIADDLADKINPKLNVKCAVQLLKEEGGWKHWFSSFSFWRDEVNPKLLK